MWHRAPVIVRVVVTAYDGTDFFHYRTVKVAKNHQSFDFRRLVLGETQCSKKRLIFSILSSSAQLSRHISISFCNTSLHAGLRDCVRSSLDPCSLSPPPVLPPARSLPSCATLSGSRLFWIPLAARSICSCIRLLFRSFS